MRDGDYARRSTASFGAYLAVTAVILGGFLGLLVFVAHPGPTTAAVVGLTVGVASGRIVSNVRELACRTTGDCGRSSESAPETVPEAA
jgi:xanthosine utilization system XapX-like protein